MFSQAKGKLVLVENDNILGNPQRTVEMQQKNTTISKYQSVDWQSLEMPLR